MNYFTLILYVSGLLGTCLSIILIGLQFYKKNKLSSILTLFISLLSILVLGTGTTFSIIDKKNSTEISNISTNAINTNTINKETKTPASKSSEELDFEYNIKSKETYSTISNNSKETFNGIVNLNVLDSNSIILSTKSISVENLLPNSIANHNFETIGNSSSIIYNFQGEFSNNFTSDYSIKSASYGKDYMKFVIIPKDSKTETLKNICKEFKEKYNITSTKGFIIYFVTTEGSDFDSAYAEYYRNNENPISNLLIYDNNQSFVI